MLAAIINFLISLLIVPPKAPMLYLGIWNYYMFPENTKLSMDRYFPILLPGMPSLSLVNLEYPYLSLNITSSVKPSMILPSSSLVHHLLHISLS